MRMIKAYLDNLAAHLPEEMRQDVREELETSIQGRIDDQKEQLGRDLNDDELESLLKTIGHPMRVASAYLPHQHLIGPEFFPAFKKTLKMALMIVLGINVLIALPFLMTSSHFFMGLIGELQNLATTALAVFSVVTLVFFMMERTGANLDSLYKWSPKELTPLKPKLSVNRIEIGFEFVVEILFLAWWNGLWSFPATVGDVTKAQILMSPEWSSVFWVVNILTALSLALSAYQFISAGWNKASLVTSVVIHMAELAVIWKILSFDRLVVLKGADLTTENWETVDRIAQMTVTWIIYFIAGIILIEIYGAIKKYLQIRHIH